MTATHEDVPGSGWHKVAALVLCIVVIGLPINNFSDYALLVILAVVIFGSDVRTHGRAWLAAVVIAIVAALCQALLSPPRIQEGHNVFLPSPTLERSLPSDVYRHLAAEFDAQYPPEKRCDPKQSGCWQSNGFPDSPFAFSADGIWFAPSYSRSVNALDFANPVWLRLGFVNEFRYNWTADTDVSRAQRDRRFWMGWDRWHLTMPWFEMISLPAAYAGGELCWRGEVMWEGEGQHFAPLAGNNCRGIRAADIGKRIVGVAIKPETLAMSSHAAVALAPAEFCARYSAIGGGGRNGWSAGSRQNKADRGPGHYCWPVSSRYSSGRRQLPRRPSALRWWR